MNNDEGVYSFARFRALLGKELLEIRRTPAALVPVYVLAGVSITVPLLIVLVVPRVAGRALDADADLQQGLEAAARHVPALAALPDAAAVQAFLLQQMLFLFLLIPIAGAMSLAAYSVIGEKQGRTLEPLLATPIATAELLFAKVAGALAWPLAIMAVSVVVYLAAVAWVAEPGVVGALLSAHTLLNVGLLGPAAALVALQLAIAVSARVNDPRGAQQIGALVILPLVAVMVAQFAGVFFLSLPLTLAAAAGLLAVWLALLAFSVKLFDRETILTRWT